MIGLHTSRFIVYIVSRLNIYEIFCAVSPILRYRSESLKVSSGTGTNLKVGVVPLQFLALKAQLVVLVSAFVMVSKVWSVSCLLFFYTHGVPPCPAICKSWGNVPRAPWRWRHYTYPVIYTQKLLDAWLCGVGLKSIQLLRQQ